MRRMLHTRLGGLVLALALASIATGGVASGYWTSSNAGGGSAALATLPAATVTSASTGAETVELSWSPITAPAGGTVEYFLTRDGGAPGGNCPSSSSRSTVTSCTDTHVAIGSHKYVVIATWRSWTSTSSEHAASVTFGPATHLVLEASSTTILAGEADNLTITAKDASNNTVATYSGPHSLIFEGPAEAPGGARPSVIDSGGSEASFGEPTEINFSEGKATTSSGANGVMKLYKAEAAHVKVKEGSLNNGTGLAVTVKAAVTSAFKLSALSEQTAAAAISVTVTAIDEYGNTTTSYTGAKTLAWSGPVESPSGHAPEYPAAATTVTFTNGVGKATGIKLYDAASTTLTVKEGSTMEGSSGSFAVKAAATKKLTLTAPTEATAGSTFTVGMSAYDEYGNLASSYTGAKTLVWSGPANSPSGLAPEYPAAVNFTGGVGAISEVDLYAAATTVTLTVKEGSAVKGSASLTVKPASATRLIVPTPAAQTAGSAFNVTLTADDEYGNTATGYAGAKTLTWSGSASSPSGHAPEYPAAATAVTFASGVGKATGIKLYNATSTALSLSDGSALEGASGSFVVKAATYKRIAWAEAGTEPAGAISSALCLFECTAEGLGSEGKFLFKVSTTDEWGNLQPSHGSGSKSVKLTSTCTGCTLSTASLTIAEGVSSSPEATFTGAPNNTWQGTLSATEGTLKATATLKH